MTMQEVPAVPRAPTNGHPMVRDVAGVRPEPDDRSGYYYVTIRDGGRHGLLAGPFHNNHQAALDLVPTIRRIAGLVNSRDAAFAGFGTSWSEVDQGPGMLHDGHTWTPKLRELATNHPELGELLEATDGS